MTARVEPSEHHVWCNFFTRPVEGCELCKRLWEKYPYQDGDDPDELVKKHFPDVIRRVPVTPVEEKRL